MARKTQYQTKQKACLLSYLESHPAKHITAGELVVALAAEGTPLGAATVYRQLEKLEAEGLVRRYSLDDRGSACWQYTGGSTDCGDCANHFHLKCTVCGQLFHLDCGHLHEIADHVAAEHQFYINAARTVFYGVCGECQKSTQGENAK